MIFSKSFLFKQIFLLLLFFSSFQQQSYGQELGLDEKINELFMPIAIAWEDFILMPLSLGQFEMPIVLILLLGGALFFTIYFRFINLRKVGLSIKIVRGVYDDLDHHDSIDEGNRKEDIIGTIKDESIEGEVNHFQALSTAVSGTVGLGNIALVAVAISIGGPGATFWMILAGLLGMSTKFVECTLGVKYREVYDNKVYGGPMYYLSKGLKEQGREKLGKGLAFLFAILCVGASFGGGNAFQSNQATAQIINTFGLSGQSIGTFIGLAFAFVVGIIIIGGIKRIGKVTEKVVPFMAIIYVGSALIILIMNWRLLDNAFIQIFQQAFNPVAGITGGVIGVMIQGFRRAAFSNEAGAGSAAIAHSAVITNHPASEGLVALLEPFIDTVLICTMTALVIIIFNLNGAFEYGNVLNDQVLLLSNSERIGGVNLTSLAFESYLPGYSYVLMVAVVLFAVSTMLSWSYYGLQSWIFLFGKSKFSVLSFKCIFLLFTVLGSAITLEAVIKFSDAMILALVFPNMIGLLLLFPKVNLELKGYLNQIKKRSKAIE